MLAVLVFCSVEEMCEGIAHGVVGVENVPACHHLYSIVVLGIGITTSSSAFPFFLVSLFLGAIAGLSRSSTVATLLVVKHRHRTIVFAETPDSQDSQ